MARITDNLLNDQTLALSIDRYQEIMQIPIAAFNGLNWPEEQPQLECANIWNQQSRDTLAMYIAAAEESRERELNYHLAPKYVVGEEQEYRSNIQLSRKHLIAIGSKATTTIESGATVTLRDLYSSIIDPVIITVDDGETYVADEIIICYPGEEVEIRPSSVSVSGTTVTIKIPRSRLVKTELNDNRSDHLYYINDDNFLETVDVKRMYTDPATGIEYVWPKSQLRQYCTPNCDEVIQTGCAQTLGHRAKRIANITTFPVNWSDGVATGTKFSQRCNPRYVRVSYLSGVQNSIRSELLTARYAHTLMPNKPCSCPLVEQYWHEDKEMIDNFFTPYGNMKGAIDAWMVDSRAQIGNAGVFR